MKTLILLAMMSGGQGYFFFGPGSSTALHLGGGGEAYIYKGLAAGGEIGYLFPRSGFGYGVGLLSANGSYHFNRGTHWKIQPFVTGGYTLAFRSGAVNLWNAGGGLTYWMSNRAGLRVEFREYRDWRHGLHELRVGLSLR